MRPYLYLTALFAVAAAAPTLLGDNDSEVVGTVIKKHVQPFEDLHEAGSERRSDDVGHAGKEFDEEDDEKGYYKSKSTKGDKGYKHFDSYHKKGGDKYGHEFHTSTDGKKSDGDGGSHYTSGSYSSKDGNSDKKKAALKDHKGAATDGDYSYSNYEADDGDDGGHYESESEGDDGHYESEGDHGDFSDEGDSGAYHDEGDADSGAYNDSGEHYTDGANSRIYDGHSGGYAGPSRATSYYIRHY